jgi:hypothetical protein
MDSSCSNKTVNFSCNFYCKSLSCSNIEDIARDAGSVDVDGETLDSKTVVTVPLNLMF